MITHLNKTQRFLLLIGALFSVMILVAVFHNDGLLTVRKFRKELDGLKENNQALRQENELLRSDIKELKTDPAAIEKIAREKLSLVKPGEVVYYVVPQPKPSAPDAK